jgi:CheY-like chemotaxis protein
VAHNINNLLTPIALGVDLIETHRLEKEEVDVLEAIKENSIRGASLSRQLLDFARGSDSSEKVHVNPEKPIRAIEKLIRTSFPENINVHVGTQPGVQSLIGNEDQLHQAILNLCINARDAMEGGGDLSLILEKVDLTREDRVLPLDCVPGNFIKIQIKDTGEGIEEKHLNNIFDPFFTTKPVGKGVGLGLSSTLGIVRNHGGFIDVKTGLNKGTEFNIYLPESNQKGLLSEDQSELLSEVEVSHDVKKEDEKVKKNFCVLVVEDEEPVRKMILRSLQKLGIQTLTATNGVEALSLFLENESQIGMTITNLRMPVMNGRDLVKLLKKADPLHIIIVSSGTAEKDMLDLQNSGLIAGYLAKPYDLRSIERVISKALKLPEEAVKAQSVLQQHLFDTQKTHSP